MELWLYLYTIGVLVNAEWFIRKSWSSSIAPPNINIVSYNHHTHNNLFTSLTSNKQVGRGRDADGDFDDSDAEEEGEEPQYGDEALGGHWCKGHRRVVNDHSDILYSGMFGLYHLACLDLP